MTPAARVQAAIELLDDIAAGAAAEQALTNWGRRSRFAGSKDRAAVRDHVFKTLRRWWSTAHLGGGKTGRARMIGLLRQQRSPLPEMFTGTGYGPASLTADERDVPAGPDGLVALDCPEWLAPELTRTLGEDFAPVMEALRHRAPVHLRVNTRLVNRGDAQVALAAEGIETQSLSISPTALEVTGGARRLRGSAAFGDGLVELQDAGSQAIVDRLPLSGAADILDYCAGGGGKTLAMAARTSAPITAHDVAARRMADLPERARRAGVRIAIRPPDSLPSDAQFDLVVADAPCSGSGAWRRNPEGKLRLDQRGLDTLVTTQDEVLTSAGRHVRTGGALAYITCSMLEIENGDRVAKFCRLHGGWSVTDRMSTTPLHGTDGFFLAILQRGDSP